ncbi:hypothetical protein MA16_Dca020417 [Dendrobium catenatum]|uniref:Uncharacterized protein n=1 Tax=Dendrobium catenatum TaxID=906689 RepID=A0A2I0VB51_9ASPA|nr:hypothetical protein MA16_Dca020417 [Dendrobium catenatum]
MRAATPLALSHRPSDNVHTGSGSESSERARLHLTRGTKPSPASLPSSAATPDEQTPPSLPPKAPPAFAEPNSTPPSSPCFL